MQSSWVEAGREGSRRRCCQLAKAAMTSGGADVLGLGMISGTMARLSSDRLVAVDSETGGFRADRSNGGRMVRHWGRYRGQGVDERADGRVVCQTKKLSIVCSSPIKRVSGCNGPEALKRRDGGEVC